MADSTDRTDKFQVAMIRRTFGFSKPDLARALNVAPFTIARWERGSNAPVGLQADVIRALHGLALLATAKGGTTKKLMGDMIRLGIGALLLHLGREAIAKGDAER